MKKRLLSALLVFCMVLTILPGTAMAAGLPPAETDYWKNLSLDASSNLLATAIDKTAQENFVFIFYRADGSNGADTSVPKYANFTAQNQIKSYGYAYPKDGYWPNGITELLGKNEGIYLPVVVTYNAATKKALAGDRLSMDTFVALLEDSDLYESGSSTDPSGYKKSGSLSMEKLSQQEIKNLLASAPLNNDTNVFEVEPTLSPCTTGRVKPAAIQAATDRLTALRKLAGLPGVTMDTALNENAQYGAVLLAVLGYLEHEPSKPAGMDDAFYKQGYEATSTSNLAAGNNMTHSVDGLMDDSDSSNIDRLGHRRWQLNPALSKVGFGYARNTNSRYGQYVTEKVFDTSGAYVDYDFVGWPASGDFPSGQLFFEPHTAWSVSLNPGKYSAPSQSAITVTLTRDSDNRKWTFSGSNYSPSDSGECFIVDNQGFGINNCIIFRPSGITAYDGLYTVEITGLKDRKGNAVDFAYQVNFFDLKDSPAPQPTDISAATVTVTPDSMEYTGSAFTPAVTVTLNGTTLTAGTDYTVAYTNNIEVGTATVTVTGKGNYTGTATANFTITAAPVEKVTPAVEANDITATLGDTLTITGTAKDGEKDVAGTWKFVGEAPNTVGTHSDVKVEFIPDDTDAYNKAEDTITVTINAAPVEKVTPVVEANDITATLGDTLTITGTAKDGEKDVAGTWSFVDAAPNTAGTHENVKVKFTPDNTAAYNEVETSITVTINAAPVEKVTPVVEANDITATLGDTLTITGTAKDGEKDVAGTWSFVDAAPNTAGTHENVKVKFTPDNTAAYNEVETSITVTINAAPVEKVTPVVSANDITVTLGNALTITGTAKDGDKTVSGTWSFVDAAPNTVGTHENVKVRFTPTNTAAYNVAETTITVTINAAPVDPTTPIVTVDDISVPYGVTVKDSDIRGTSNVPGVWSFVGTVPTAVGSHRVTVRFTPNDTAAYKSVDRVITLRIYAVDHGDITDWVNFPHNDVIGRPVSNLVAEVVDWIFNQYGVRFAAADFNVYVNEYSVNLASIVRNDTRYVLYFNGNAADNAVFENLFNSRRTLTFGVERESGEEYYIALEKSDNGQVIANTRYAESGARVTLSVHPDSGYELDTLEVIDVRGRTLTLRDLEDGRYSFTMPSCRVTVEAAFKTVKEDRPSLPGPDHTAQNPHDEIFTGLGTPGISGIVLNPAAMPFTDVHGPDWFYNHVEYMWKHYLMSGTSENRFDPNLTTSRAMIWTIMARMNNVRTDINPGSTWYEKGMLWAMERGITDGSNAMGDITREQLATMLWRNAGSPITGGDLSRFSDADSVSAYALNAVRWASSNGILSGINGRIEPQGTATRAQVAAMVARYGDKVVR